MEFCKIEFRWIFNETNSSGISETLGQTCEALSLPRVFPIFVPHCFISNFLTVFKLYMNP